MKSVQFSSGINLLIREAKKEDASEIINYINKVGGETDNLTFGEGGFGISEEEEAAFIESISAQPKSSE